MKKNRFVPILLGLFLGFVTTLSAQDAKRGQPAVFDFDGDKISDPVLIENVDSNLTWHILQSRDGLRTVVFGLSELNDIAVPADYDGDNKWDIAVWRPGNPTDYRDEPANFWILLSKSESVAVVPFGRLGDNPRITQDFDGDGHADPAVVRRENGQMTWWIMYSKGGYAAIPYGLDTDYFLRGDFDGDRKADLAVYRMTEDKWVPPNTFIIQRSSDNGLMFSTFGIPGDLLVPGDFDADGATDIAVYRDMPSKGMGDNAYWFWQRSSDGTVEIVPFGLSLGVPGILDCPVPGDYDKDQALDLAIWRVTTGEGQPSEFHVMLNDGYQAFQFGMGYMEIPNCTLQVVDTKHPQ